MSHKIELRFDYTVNKFWNASSIWLKHMGRLAWSTFSVFTAQAVQQLQVCIAAFAHSFLVYLESFLALSTVPNFSSFNTHLIILCTMRNLSNTSASVLIKHESRSTFLTSVNARARETIGQLLLTRITVSVINRVSFLKEVAFLTSAVWFVGTITLVFIHVLFPFWRSNAVI